MNLQILIQPMWSKKELNSDSCYVLIYAFVTTALKVCPDWQFVLLFPDSKSGFKYDADGLFALPNIIRVPQRVTPRKLGNAITYDAGFYDQLLRKFGFDIIWCHLVEAAGHLKAGAGSSYETAGRPILVASHNYVIHKSLPYPLHSIENVMLQQILGAVSADKNVFDSKHCGQMMVESASDYLRADRVQQIVDRSVFIPHGVLEPELKPSAGKNKQPVIVYNHRLQAYKQWRTTFDLLKQLYDEGLKFRVKFTSSTTDNLGALSPYAAFTDIRLCATRQEYLREITGADLNVTNSMHETFCISAVESMALGQPLIAPYGVTFPEITGMEELHYPYLFRNEDEQKAMLRKLLTDSGERLKWGKLLSAYVHKNYNQQLWLKRYSEVFMAEVETHEVERERPELDQAVVNIIKRDKLGATLRDVFNELNGLRINGLHSIGNQSFSMTKMVRYMRKLGFQVHLEGDVQRVFPAQI